MTFSENQKAIVWTILGSGGARVLLIVGNIITANILGPSQYGEFGIIRSSINLALVLSGLNLGLALTKHLAGSEGRPDEKATTITTHIYFIVTVLVVGFTGVVLLLSHKICHEVFLLPEILTEFRLGCVSFFFAVIFPLNEAVFRGFGWYSRLAILQVIGGVVFAVIVPYGACLYGIFGAVSGYVIYTVAMTLMTGCSMMFDLKKLGGHIFTLENLSRSPVEAITYLVPILLAAIIEAPIFWLSQVLLIRSAGAEDNGIVMVVMQFRNLLLLIPSYVALVVLPMLAEEKKRKNEDGYQNVLRTTIRVNFFTSIFATIVFIFINNQIFKLYGGSYVIPLRTVILCMVTVPLLVVGSIIHQSLLASDKVKAILVISVVWNSVFILSTYFLVSVRGLGKDGFLMAMLIGVVVLTSMRVYCEKK